MTGYHCDTAPTIREQQWGTPGNNGEQWQGTTTGNDGEWQQGTTMGNNGEQQWGTTGNNNREQWGTMTMTTQQQGQWRTVVTMMMTVPSHSWSRRLFFLYFFFLYFYYRCTTYMLAHRPLPVRSFQVIEYIMYFRLTQVGWWLVAAQTGCNWLLDWTGLQRTSFLQSSSVLVSFRM